MPKPKPKTRASVGRRNASSTAASQRARRTVGEQRKKQSSSSVNTTTAAEVDVNTDESFQLPISGVVQVKPLGQRRGTASASNGLKGTRLSFSSALEGSSDGGESVTATDATTTTTAAAATVSSVGFRSAGLAPLASHPHHSGSSNSNSSYVNRGGWLLGRTSSLSTSLMRAAASRTSPSLSSLPAKRSRPQDPFLQNEEDVSAAPSEAPQVALAVSYESSRENRNEEEIGGIAAAVMQTPPRITKKPRLTSPKAFAARQTRGSLGLSSLNVNLSPTSRFVLGFGSVPQREEEEAREGVAAPSPSSDPGDDASAPATVKKCSQRDGVTGDESDPTAALEFTPDETVQAILSQDPPTATREAVLKPGFAPPSPQTPLWAALEARQHPRDARSEEANGEEEEDIFALDWSPLSVPRRSRGSLHHPPNAAPQQQQQQQEQEQHEAGAGNDAAPLATGLHERPVQAAAEKNEEEGEEYLGSLVASRGTYRADHPQASLRSTASLSLPRGRPSRSHSMQTAAVSVRGSRSLRRHRQASASVDPSARQRSINLLDADGLHDDEVEPFFGVAASNQSRLLGPDNSFETMLAVIEGRDGSNGNDIAHPPPQQQQQSEEGEAWVSLTQEAAELEGVEEGHGIHLSRTGPGDIVNSARGPRARPQARTKPSSSASSSVKVEETVRGEAAPLNSGKATNHTAIQAWVTSGGDNTSIFPAASQSATPPPDHTSLPSSQPTSARTQRMIAWAEQARSFFRFIDQRPLLTVSPGSKRRTLTGGKAGGGVSPTVGSEHLLSSQRQQPHGRKQTPTRPTNVTGLTTPIGNTSARSVSARQVMTTPPMASPRTPVSQRTQQQPQRQWADRLGRPLTRGEVVPSSARVAPNPSVVTTGRAPTPSAGSAQTGTMPSTAAASASSRSTPATSVGGTQASNSSSTTGSGSGGFAAMIARAKQRAAAAAATTTTSPQPPSSRQR